MKALRYLLIVVAMLSVLSVSAQMLAQLPEATMHSTSAMVGSGSTLPSAAANGAVITGNVPGSYSPANGPTGPRRGSVNPGGGPDEGDNSEPYEDPIGDAALPLALMAAAYALLRVYKCKRARV